MAKRVWIIDVCRSCSRPAHWPFCEHKGLPPPAGADKWYETVRVREA